MNNFVVAYIKFLKDFFKDKKSLFFIFVISITFHLIGVLNSFLLFKSLGVSVSFSFVLFAIPLNRLVLSLPISYGGIGLNEMSLIKIFSLVNISAETMVSFSILGYVNIVFLFILFTFYILHRNFFGAVSKLQF